MANEFVTRTGLIVSGSTYLPAATSASKGYILSFDTSTKEVYYMSTSSVTVTVPGSDTQVIYNNGGSFGASSNFVFSGSNVGIGTTTPGEKIYVSGTNVGVAIDGVTSSRTYYNRAGAYIWSTGLRSGDTKFHIYDERSIDRFVIDDSGNVGIGITSPEAKLDVSGSIKILYPTGKLYAAATPSFYGEITPFNSSGQMIFNVNYPEGNIIFQSGSVEVARFKDAKLGIGTTSPLTLLDLRASSNTSITPLASVPDTATTLLIGNTGTNGVLALGHDNAGHPWLQGRSVLANQAAEDILINPLGGNVGIGTTSPSEILDVQKAGTVAVRVYNTSSTADAYFNAKNSTGDAFFGINATGQYLYTSNNIPTIFYNSGSERMRITNAGNVGIGTTSPSGKLDIVPSSQNGINIARAGGYASIYGSNDLVFETDSVFYFGVYTPRLFSVNGNFYVSSGGLTSIGKSSANATLDVTGSVLISGSLTVSGSSTFTNIGPAVFTGSITQNASTASFGGLVGIGTTTPSASLNIASDGNTQFTITRTNASNSKQFNINVESDSQTSISYDSNSPLVIGTSTNPGTQAGFTESMRITSGGNVGIGIASPSQKLQVNGSIALNTVTNGSSRYYTYPDANHSWYYDDNILGSSADVMTYYENFLIRYQDTTNVFSINGNGYVGIGTTSPSRKLIVYDTDANVPTIGLRTDGSGTTTGDGFDLQFSSNNTFLFNRESGYMSFGTDNTERVRIAATGDTHIGTTAYAGIGGSGYLMVKNVIGLVPDNTASTNNRNWAIQANGQFSGSLDFVTSAASASFPNDAYRVSFTRTGGVVASSFTGSFSGSVSAPGSTTQIVYNSGGALAADSGLVYSGSRVGINISTPQALLDVNGDIYNRSGAIYTNTIAGYSTNVVAINASTNFYVPSGNVGIGTTSPSQKLHVSGSALINGTIYSGDGSISTSNSLQLQYSAASGDGVISSKSTGGSTTLALQTSDSGTTATKLYITSAGAVGIGTTSPSLGSKIQVEGNIFSNNVGGNAFSINSAGANYGFILNNSANTFSLGYGTSLGTVGTSVLTWNSSGNVGIGDTSPQGPLVVYKSNSGGLGGHLILNNNGLAVANETAIMFNDSGVGAVNGVRAAISSTTEGSPYYGDLKFKTGNGAYSDLYTRMIVTGAGNVGIGVTSPTYNLEVSGSGYISGSLTVAGTITAQKLNVQQVTSSVIYSSGSNIFGNDITNTQTFTGSIQATGSTHYLLGNVGIGTTSPATKLVVDEGGFAVQGTSSWPSSGFGLEFWNNSGTSYIGSYNRTTSAYRDLFLFAKDTIFENGGTTRMFITSTGNVGIGTVTPGYKLDVKGTGRFDDSVQLYAGSAGNSPRLIFGGETSSTDKSIFLESYYMVFQGHNNEGFKFQTTDSTGSITNRMVVLGSGNVGIGTTSPGAQLDITKTFNARAGSQSNPTGGASVAIDYQTTSDIQGRIRSRDWDGATWKNLTLEADDILLSPAGNVGIGTTSPNVKLQIIGPSLTVNDENTYGLWVSETGDETKAVILGYDQGIDAGIITAVDKATAWKDLILQPNGSRVGIGVTAPVSALHVVGDGDTVTLQKSNSVPALAFSGSSTNKSVIEGGDNFNFYTSGSSRMYISGSGNVGIGTTSPAYKLDVTVAEQHIARFTSTTADNGGLIINKSNASYNPNLVLQAGGSTKWYILNASNDSDKFQLYESTGTFSRFTLTQGGDVGIGTTSPSAKLDVEGGTLTVGSETTYAARFTNGVGTKPITIGSDTSYAYIQSWSSGPLVINSQGNNVLFPNTSTNVGIGTYSPSTILHLSSTTPELSFTATGLNRTSTVGMGDGANFYIKNTSAGNMYISDYNSVYIAYGASSQNVGIGTTSPSYKLHVSGAIAIQAESTTTKYSTTFSGSLTGNTNIAFIPTGSFKAAFFDYYVASGSVNMRAGTVMTVQNNSTSRYTDTSTGDIGNTSAVDFSTSVVGGDLVLTANISSGTWEIKTSYRAL